MGCNNTALCQTTEELEARINMIDWFANELTTERTVFEGVFLWSRQDVDESVLEDKDLPRLMHMAIDAGDDHSQLVRVGKLLQLLFRRHAHELAEDLVGQVDDLSQIRNGRSMSMGETLEALKDQGV